MRNSIVGQPLGALGRATALALPALMVATLGVGCEEPPGNNQLQPALRLTPERTSVAVNQVIKLTAVTPGDNAITLSVENPANVTSGVSLVDQGPSGTATQDPDDDGKAIFDFTCLSGAGAVRVTASTEGETDRTITINCFIPVDDVRLSLRNVNCGGQLIADGQSSCDVKAVVLDAEGAPAADRLITLTVDEASLVTGGPAALDPAFATGVPEMLSLTGANPQKVISGSTGANGQLDFKVVSPVFQLEQTFNIVGKVGNAEELVQVKIGPFTDQTELAINASPAAVTEGGTSTITVVATGANGQPAAQATVVLRTDNAAFVLTETELVTDATGTATTTVTMPAVDANAVTATVIATFDSLPNEDGAGNASASVTVTSTPEGAASAEVGEFDVDEISLDNTAPDETASLTITASQDGDPFENVSVEVRVLAASNEIIRIQSANDGDANDPVALTNGAVTVSSIGDGRLEVIVTPKDAASIGLGTVQVIVRNNLDQTVLQNVQRTVEVKRQPRATSLFFAQFNPAEGVIGVPGGPLPSTVEVTFRLLDDSNQPLGGKTVTFIASSSSPPGGATPSEVITDAAGEARTVITAGTVAAPITVTARHVIDATTTLTASSTPIAVVGGVPNSAYSALGCSVTAAFDPFTADCAIALADRFTDVVETDTNVQFRAEGGNIQASQVASGGVATSTFTFSEPGPGSADVRQWSYSPLRNAPSSVRAAFPGCFDTTTQTPCDLIAMCSSADAAAQAFCPLPPSTINNASVCVTDISQDTLDAIDDENANPADWAFERFFPEDPVTGFDPLPGVNVSAQFEAYQTQHRLCGMPVSCLTGQLAGLTFEGADDCPVNPGCLDFSGATQCPQDGLLQILAAVRGEEGFDDVNGDGIRQASEDFIDYPEPFLDKNSSCSYDSLNAVASLSANEKVRLSDQFIDFDGDGVFGFAGQETNSEFDRDTEIFVTTNIVHLAGQRTLQFGQIGSVGQCGADNSGVATCGDPGLGTSSCTETARSHLDGQVLLQGCDNTDPDEFREGEFVDFGFRWTDNNGNCPSADFAGTPAVSVTGPAKLFVQDDAYSAGECGAPVGAINASNVERPWCEEHPIMGAPIRTLTVQADCGGEEGTQFAELTFELDGVTRKKSITIGCPVCGDNRIEGEEQCDNGAANGGTAIGDCDAECALVTE